jgi:hypothetical protein
MKSLMEYEELIGAGKLESMDVWWKYVHTEKRELLGREAFEVLWTNTTILPCPSVRCVAICRRWIPLPREEVNRFLAAGALEELSHLMRWLFPQT